MLFSFLFIPANWNSYSKSDTARKPRRIMLDLYFLQRLVVKVLKVITSIFFFEKLRSANNAFFTISFLSSILNKKFFWFPSDIPIITLLTNLRDFFITSIWP